MDTGEFAKQNLDDLDYFHSKAVVELALELAEKEGADKEIVEAAAWLHDIGKMRKESKLADHHLHSVEIAKDFLKEQGKDDEFISRVCQCIKEHMGPYFKGLVDATIQAGLAEEDIPRPSTMESRCVYDADMLNYMGPWGTSKIIFLRAKQGKSYSEVIKERKKMPGIIFDDLQTGPGKEMGKKELEFIEKFMKKINVED